MAQFRQELEAWMYNSSDEDQRTEHRYSPNRPVSNDVLAELGVLCWKLDVSIPCEENKVLDEIKAERGYDYTEYITVSPDKLDNYEQNLKRFFTEHLHPYDESRLILEGSGFWDIRGYDGEWIRFRVGKGDMIVLPPGMYHRFTLDETNYIKALLLFKEVPKRVDMMKPEAEEILARKEYVNSVLMNNIKPASTQIVDVKSTSTINNVVVYVPTSPSQAISTIG